MKKKIFVVSAGLLIGTHSALSAAALSTNALLAFNSGSQTCNSSGANCSVQGSYFSVDTNGDQAFSAYEAIGITPGSDGGLLVGQAQVASGSHTGSPDGSETAPFDAPWSFYANTGMHQSTTPVNIVSDDGNGHVLLDFSGWGATWNGIVNIPLGGDSANFPSDTGQAVVSCGYDCSFGDSFVLDYSAHVPVGDPSGFGTVFWGLHLEGTVSAVPIPAAIWLFGSGLLGLAGFIRDRRNGPAL